jgi:hypothetical protein
MPQDTSISTKKTIDQVHKVHEFHEHEGRRWPITLAYLGAAFLVALIVVFGGRWLYRSVTDSDQDSDGSTQKTASTEKESAKGAVIVPAAPSSGSVSTPRPTPPPVAAPTTNMPATGDQLPNTGG